MNKEIIKKYKAEFGHWLDGGNVLVYTDCWSDVGSSYKWGISNAHIINDEYVEYRKALAEGKTVENWNGSKHLDIGTSGTNFGNFSIDSLRIKPDEPKSFRIGDYVVCTDDTKGLVTKVRPSQVVYKDNKKTYEHCNINVKLWTLEEASDDEWVCIIDRVNSTFFCREKSELTSENYLYINRTKVDIVPYIGQTAKELGLEG